MNRESSGGSSHEDEGRWRVVSSAIWPLLALAACMALLGAIIGGLFTVRQVQVVGARLPVSAIVRAADVSGQNIFSISSDTVISRLDRVPEIVVQRVDVSFPDRVIIYARARTPMVALRTGNQLFVMDPNGKIIHRVQSTSLPVIVGAGPGASLNPGIVQAVRYAVQTMPYVWGGRIATFRLSSRTGLTIVGRAGWSADVGTGSAQKLIDRIALLSATIHKLRTKSQRLTFIDLRFPVPYARTTGI
jgi:cell division septal protein FtsQ